MKPVLLLLLLGLASVSVRADDWKTSDGKTYTNVKVVSHDDAYVTILDDSGGGRILIATLNAELQKQFGYDPVKAAAEIAKVAAQDEKDKEALAREQQASQAAAQQGQDALNDAVAQASLPPPPGTATPVANNAPDSNAAPASGDVANEGPAYGTTEIDSYPYGYYGGYVPYNYGYVPYSSGYGVYSSGYRGYGSHGGGGFPHGTTPHAVVTPGPAAAPAGRPGAGAVPAVVTPGHH